MAERGTFLTFEGGEGSGKSTQIARLARQLESGGLPVRVLREPGGTGVGEAVRALLLDPEFSGLDSVAELLLYEASRAQLVAEVIEPALESGEVVICDRFYDSTTAYQGYARELPLARVRELNAIATNGLEPDRTILLDLPALSGLNRYEGDKKGMSLRQMSLFSDRIERASLEFHDAVRRGFLAIAAQEPGRVRVIDASSAPDEVAERVAAALADLPQLAGAL